jgi:hypothetical protein
MTEKTKETAGAYTEKLTCTVPWGDDRALALAEDFKKFAQNRNVDVTIRRGDCPQLRAPGIH